MKGQVTAPLVRSMASSHIFKIMFVNQGKVYEVYARKVGQGRLFGFIEVEELVFGERSTVVLDPGEERIKSEFAGVKCTMLPMHSILRIDEVKKQGVSKVSAFEGSNVSAFPDVDVHARQRSRRQEVDGKWCQAPFSSKRCLAPFHSSFCTIRALNDRAPRRLRSLRFPHRKTAPRARSHSSRDRRHQRALRALRRSRRAISTRANPRCSSGC